MIIRLLLFVTILDLLQIFGSKTIFCRPSLRFPLLIAANTESGGNGAVTDGTKIGDEIKIAATTDPRYAYEIGKVAGLEAAAVGCNASLAPIMDLSRNWRNPIIANRTWGANVDQVIELSKEYMRGIMEHGIVPFAKHFPGDGIDERDHHLSFASNPMTKSEWMETFGRIYGEMADAGLPGIMAGHIHLPNVEKEMHPERELDDMLPASLNKTLLDELLRGELGYNGAIVTDASHMIGMTASMPRRELLPTAIEAGCDLFLFFNDPEEDLQWMKEGLENGLLSEERLHDALRRTLGLKAKLGLHLFEGRRQEIMLPKEEALALIGRDEAKQLAKEVADKAITLVKAKQEGIFPVNPERYKRILLVEVDGYKGWFWCHDQCWQEESSRYAERTIRSSRSPSIYLGKYGGTDCQIARRRKTSSDCKCLCFQASNCGNHR